VAEESEERGQQEENAEDEGAGDSAEEEDEASEDEEKANVPKRQRQRRKQRASDSEENESLEELSDAPSDRVERYGDVEWAEAKAREAEQRREFLTLGMLGHPNSGKSSIINALVGRKVVSVSKTPGHTKHLQTIVLNETTRLLDCPGLVFPAVDMPKPLQILCGLYNIAQVREPYTSVQFLAERLAVEKIYGLQLPPGGKRAEAASAQTRRVELTASLAESRWSAWLLCEAYAQKRGYRTRNGGLDTYRAGNEILRDAHIGRCVLHFLPPPQHGHQQQQAAAAAEGVQRE
jgi:ribosome biogenesis GTPase A